MPAASLRLAVLQAWLAAAPMALAALGGGEQPELGGVWARLVLLLVSAGPLVWLALGEEQAPGTSPWSAMRLRAAELGLLALASAPGLALAWPLAATGGAAGRLALSLALTWGAAVGVWWAAGVSRRGLVLIWCALAGATPLLDRTARDLLGGSQGLPDACLPASPSLAVGVALEGGDGNGLGWAAGAVLLGAALAAVRARGRAAAVGMLGLGALGLMLQSEPARAAPQLVDVRPLLGDRVRPGEPAPLRLQVRGGPGRLAARSLASRWSIATAQPGEATLELAPVPLGGSGRLTLELEELEPGGPRWVSSPRPLLEARPLGPQEPLVAVLGGEATLLPAALLPIERPLNLAREDLPLLARAGEAVDVVLVDRALDGEERAWLRAWCVAGGVAVVGRQELLEQLGGEDLAARGAVQGGVRVRPLGAGLLVGPAEAGPLDLALAGSEWRARLLGRALERARRAQLADAVLAWGAPGPSAALAWRAAWAGLGAALAFTLLAPLGRGRPLGTTLGLAGLLGLGVVLAVSRVVPARPAVYGRSAAVWELPAGARAARRVSFVTAAAARRATPATLRLRDPGGGPALPLFAGSGAAARAETELSAGPGPTLAFPAGPAPRAFARIDTVLLSGTVEVTKGRGSRSLRIVNGSGLPWRRAFALHRGGIYELGPLAAGATREFELLSAPLPFARWRLTALLELDPSWRALVTAALGGRDLARALLVIAELEGAPRLEDGAACERAGPDLLLVEASPETS